MPTKLHVGVNGLVASLVNTSSLKLEGVVLLEIEAH